MILTPFSLLKSMKGACKSTKKLAKGEEAVIAAEYQTKKKEKHWKEYFLISDDA